MYAEGKEYNYTPLKRIQEQLRISAAKNSYSREQKSHDASPKFGLVTIPVRCKSKINKCTNKQTMTIFINERNGTQKCRHENILKGNNRKAIHCSTIAWKIPWTEEPGRLQSMGSQRVRHDWASDFTLTFFHNDMTWLFEKLNVVKTNWRIKKYSEGSMLYKIFDGLTYLKIPHLPT